MAGHRARHHWLGSLKVLGLVMVGRGVGPEPSLEQRGGDSGGERSTEPGYVLICLLAHRCSCAWPQWRGIAYRGHWASIDQVEDA